MFINVYSSLPCSFPALKLYTVRFCQLLCPIVEYNGCLVLSLETMVCDSLLARFKSLLNLARLLKTLRRAYVRCLFAFFNSNDCISPFST